MDTGRLAPIPRILSLVLLAPLGAVPALAGCYRPVPVPEAHPRQLADAEAAYLRGDTAEALHGYERFRAANPSSSHVPLALYFEGRCLLLEGKPILARQRFEEALVASPDPSLDGQVRMALGDSYFVEDRYDEAETAYLAAGGSGGVAADEVLYKSALCARRLGRWEDAEGRLREVVEHFPGSLRHDAAERHLAYTGRHFAIQTGMFGIKENAESQAEEIRRSGVRVKIQPVAINGDQLYRVTVGEFAGYDEAKEELDDLRQRGVLTDAMIVP